MSISECSWDYVTFQRLMEACLGDKNFEVLLINLDDILIRRSEFCVNKTFTIWFENQSKEVSFLRKGS